MDEQLLCPCLFQLVLRYNPGPNETVGKEIEPEVIAGILLDLRKQFGNFTIIGSLRKDEPGGSWKGQDEPSTGIKVAIPGERIPELEAFVYNVGVRLGQEAMYFEAGPPSVKIIKIEAKDAGRIGEGGK